MSIVELAMGLAAAMVIAVSGLSQICIQGAMQQQVRGNEFYLYEVPRLSRALQTMVGKSQSVVVYDNKNGAASTSGIGSALKISKTDPATGQSDDTWLAFNASYGALEYTNKAGNVWYLGSGMMGVGQFAMNSDGTITVYLQSNPVNGKTHGIEVVLERQ